MTEMEFRNDIVKQARGRRNPEEAPLRNAQVFAVEFYALTIIRVSYEETDLALRYGRRLFISAKSIQGTDDAERQGTKGRQDIVGTCCILACLCSWAGC